VKAIEARFNLKTVLFIVPYPKGSAPSQRFRFEQYFGILKANGIQFTVSSFWSERAWSILYQQQNIILKTYYLVLGYIKRLFLLGSIKKYDLIFIHREAAPVGPPLIEYIISNIFKKKIIYDFDDAIWLPNTSNQNKLAQYFKHHSKVNSICKWSWKVSCGNDFLANYARKFNRNVFVNPTTIDTNYHRPKGTKQNNEKLVVGWTGTHSTAKYLTSIIPIIEQLISKYTIEFLVISNQNPKLELDGYRFIKWNKTKEIEQLDKIDIGIMPLNDTVWEEGKCGFKALQYMALEKATVVSDVGVNKNIVDHELNGFLCQSDKEWMKYLSSLIENQKLRKSIGKQGRKIVIANYSVTSNTELFLSLFE